MKGSSDDDPPHGARLRGLQPKLVDWLAEALLRHRVIRHSASSRSRFCFFFFVFVFFFFVFCLGGGEHPAVAEGLPGRRRTPGAARAGDGSSRRHPSRFTKKTRKKSSRACDKRPEVKERVRRSEGRVDAGTFRGGAEPRDSSNYREDRKHITSASLEIEIAMEPKSGHGISATGLDAEKGPCARSTEVGPASTAISRQRRQRGSRQIEADSIIANVIWKPRSTGPSFGSSRARDVCFFFFFFFIFFFFFF